MTASTALFSASPSSSRPPVSRDRLETKDARESGKNRDSNRDIAGEKDDVSRSDNTLFQELMASFFGMVKTQPDILVVGPEKGNATADLFSPIASGGTGATMNDIGIGSVLPLPASAGKPLSGDFLSTLTAGTPMLPPSDSTSPPATPIPLLPDAAASTTPSLTVSPYLNADPVLSATGLNPASMETARQEMAVRITTVSSGADAARALTAVADTALSDADVGPASNDAGEFDPVEFRIAQKFQRPLAGTVSTVPAAAAPAAGYQGATPDNSAGGSIQDPSVKGQSGHRISTIAQPDTRIEGNGGSFAPLLQTVSADASTVSTYPNVPAFGLAASAASSVVHTVSAAQSHPAVQSVAAVIAKAAKTDGPQTISMRLDPPELGKLQVEMKYKKGDPLRVHVVLEKADTAAMFQQDSHALEAALKDAGLQTDGSTLTFEFSQNGGQFDQSMQESTRDATPPGVALVSAENVSDIEAVTPEIYTDTSTGLKRYNLRV